VARILAIDYGKKRTGIAVTDPMQIIASALTTLETKQVLAFLQTYTKTESVERMIIGFPVHWDGSDTDATPLVRAFMGQIKKHVPGIPLETVDERYTSVLAKQAMLDMGMKKKDRQQKGNVDQIAAAIMLQAYLESRAHS
jgi:putative Holliday junction resolvase